MSNRTRRSPRALFHWAGIIMAACLPLTSACATQQASYSGFLGDYSQLAPSPRVQGAMVYRHPQKPLASYQKFFLDPVVVHFSPDAEGTALDPAQLFELTSYFRTELSLGLSARGKLAPSPGPGVLRVRIALTDVKTTTPIMNIHPATKLSGLGLGGASMEAELVDSITGERIMAAVDSRPGSRLGLTQGLTKLGHAKEVIRFWVSRFLERIDEERDPSADS